MDPIKAVPAEDYAESLIRTTLAAGGTPDLPAIADRTALTVAEVERIRDRVLSGKRAAAPGYRAPGRVTPPAQRPPQPAPAAQRAPAGFAQGRVDALITAGEGHGSARVRRAAKRVTAAVDALQAAMDAEVEAEAARKAQSALDAEEARLLAQLEALRAKHGLKCDHPGCGLVAADARGLSVHRARKHGGAA